MASPVDTLTVLKGRRAPVVKDGVAHLPGSGFAQLAPDGTVHFADPASEKVESDDSTMRHRFKVSTPAVDRAGDVVLPRGCEPYLARYAKNPQVFFNHASFGLPVAMSKSPLGELGVLVTDDALYADAYFHGVTDESEKVYELVKLGYLNAASIGFRPLKARLLPETRGESPKGVLDFQAPGLEFLEWELLEWSVVGVPCNHEALDGLKSWMGKHSAADTPLHQALKAMLAQDRARPVTVSVTGTVPGTVSQTPSSVPPKGQGPVGDLLTITPAEADAAVEAVAKALAQGAATSNEVRKPAGTGKDQAGEEKAPRWVCPRVPSRVVRDVAYGQQDPANPQLLGLRDIRQSDYFSCGAAAAMTVGQYLGVGPHTLDEWKAALGTTIEHSTHPERIVEYFRSLGCVAEGRSGMSVADLAAEWVRGNPVICPVQDYGPAVPKEAEFEYGHYLTVIGVALGYVFCQDSSDSNVEASTGTIDALGKIMVAEADWVKAWYDRDKDGNPFSRYGIVVRRAGMPGAIEPNPADAHRTPAEFAGPEDSGASAPDKASGPTTGKGAGGHVTPTPPAGAPELNALPPGPAKDDVTGPGGAPKPVPLQGAQALLDLLPFVEQAMAHCDLHAGRVEHPKVAPFLAEKAGELGVLAKAVRKFGRKQYPDHFPDEPAPGGKSEPAPLARGDTGPAGSLGATTPAWDPALLAKLADALSALQRARAEIDKKITSLTGRP